MKTQVVSATEFKARWHSLLDEVEKQGTSITVTKRGRPIATIGPAPKQKWKSLQGAWVGKVEIVEPVIRLPRAGRSGRRGGGGVQVGGGGARRARRS